MSNQYLADVQWEGFVPIRDVACFNEPKESHIEIKKSKAVDQIAESYHKQIMAIEELHERCSGINIEHTMQMLKKFERIFDGAGAELDDMDNKLTEQIDKEGLICSWDEIQSYTEQTAEWGKSELNRILTEWRSEHKKKKKNKLCP